MWENIKLFFETAASNIWARCKETSSHFAVIWIVLLGAVHSGLLAANTASSL